MCVSTRSFSEPYISSWQKNGIKFNQKTETFMQCFPALITKWVTTNVLSDSHIISRAFFKGI